MSIFNVISMLGGLALFLYGMRIMGDGLKKESSGSFKKALEKVTGNPIMGFLIGAGLTAIIQSATATIVIVSGLVGAGIMTLQQSIGIIFGANVGTTITGQIIRLLDVDASGTQWLNFFKPDTLAPIAAIIGVVFIMFVKSKKSSTVGTIAMGFGILFTGLLNMTSAISPLSQSESFIRFFISFGERPVLAFFAGFIVAFALQSSSASVGILQALSVTGALTFGAIYPILMGIYIGDCVTTAIVCSIGTKAEAKRTGMVNILFNLGEILLVVITVNLLHSFGLLSGLWGRILNSGGIANTHTVFKLSTAIVLLPFAKSFGKLSEKIIKDNEKQEAKRPEIQALDEALFKSPALALNSCYKALSAMANMISVDIDRALDLFDKYDAGEVEKLDDDEDFMDDLEDNINAYLAKLSPHLNVGLQDSIQNYYLQCVTDFERAGDHINSIVGCAIAANEDELEFSDVAKEEVNVIQKALRGAIDNTVQAFRRQDREAARNVQPYVEVVNMLMEKDRNNHMVRIRSGICNAASGSVYMDVLMHIGRVADMCSNIAVHTLVRHSDDPGNYEHQYTAALRRGEDEHFNEVFEQLKTKFGL